MFKITAWLRLEKARMPMAERVPTTVDMTVATTATNTVV